MQICQPLGWLSVSKMLPRSALGGNCVITKDHKSDFPSLQKTLVSAIPNAINNFYTSGTGASLKQRTESKQAIKLHLKLVLVVHYETFLMYFSEKESDNHRR